MIVCITLILTVSIIVGGILINNKVTKDYELYLDNEKSSQSNFSYSLYVDYYIDHDVEIPTFHIKSDIYDNSGNLIDCLYHDGEVFFFDLEHPEVYSKDENGEIFIKIDTIEINHGNQIIFDKKISTNIEDIKDEEFVRADGEVKRYKTKKESVIVNVTKFEARTLRIKEQSEGFRVYSFKYSLIYFTDVVNIYQSEHQFTCEDLSVIEKLDKCCK